MGRDLLPPTMFTLQLVLDTGCQPVPCDIVICNGLRDAASDDFMTRHRVGLIIKCTGGRNGLCPTRYGFNANLPPGCQPEVLNWTVNHWRALERSVPNVMWEARGCFRNRQTLCIHCNRGQVRVPAAFGCLAGWVTHSSVQVLDRGLSEGPCY